MKRNIKHTFKGKPVLEGAGVHLKRVFGFNEIPQFDPFLLFDDFRSDEPSKFIKGFPWHPHRGIETITYVLEGDVEHRDSLGNKGIISSGDVQWMTAGSGIIHQEMPKGTEEGKMYGFQLWTNLPASHKMMSPRYRDIKSSEIPELNSGNGVKIKIICGKLGLTEGPAKDIVTEPEYFDVYIPSSTEFTLQVKKGNTAFAYIIEGSGYFCEERNRKFENTELILFDDGDEINIKTGEEHLRFLFCSGKPLNEPIAWGGPIVMNTREELNKAFEEFHNGTFIKNK